MRLSVSLKKSKKRKSLKRVPRLVEKLESIPEVTSELEASIREDGYVLDSASPTYTVYVRDSKDGTRYPSNGSIPLHWKECAIFKDNDFITIRNHRYVLQ